jgi:uncharacterized membrane protein YgaE (UPF0421/DUF939 family)
MKAKTIISIIAAIFIVVVIIKIITDVGPNGDWTLALVFIGLLVGILAVIINGLPEKEKSADDYSKLISQQTSKKTNQNFSPEQKALRALESGAIDYAEYEDELKKTRKRKNEQKRQRIMSTNLWGS